MLTYLEKLEIGLSTFSYEELGIVEAGELKKTFEVFKHGLEEKVFGGPELQQLKVIYEKVGIQSVEDKYTSREKSTDIFSLIKELRNTPLSKNQKGIVDAINKLAQEFANIELNTTENMPTNFQSIEKSLESGYSSKKINLKPVLEDCMGQMELMEELIRMFKQNVLEFIGSTKFYLLNEDYDALDLACQKIVPTLRMMKTHGLLEITQQMTMRCRSDKDMKHLAFLYDQFIQEYPSIEEQVDFEMEMFRTM